VEEKTGDQNSSADGLTSTSTRIHILMRLFRCNYCVSA